jgi:hypothetical protein
MNMRPVSGAVMRAAIGFLLVTTCAFTTGCQTSAQRKATFEQKMLSKYQANGREARFHDLQKRYDSRLVLYMNQKKDRWWITNFSAWLVSSLLDLPSLAAGGSIYGIILLVAWWVGVALTGGGVLAVLAWIGTHIAFADITGVSPVIVGILALCVLYSLLAALFGIFI